MSVRGGIASQHLRVLRQAELAKTKRDHKFIFYNLDYGRIARTTKAIQIFEVGNGRVETLN